jgi:exoribonuclease R
VKIQATLTDELVDGLQGIRQQFNVPAAFPAAVLQAADDAARRPLTAHIDRTDWPFVTLDPATSTDLDQAFHIEVAGKDVLLHYAIADVAWFVDDAGALDAEAWQRGTTQYLPDGKAGLYPPALAEGAASLLPDGPRPAIVFHVRVGSDGLAKLDGVDRAIIRSRAKLAYETVQASQLPDAFPELSRRIAAAQDARGASGFEPPEQIVDVVGGGYEISFRPRLQSEDDNAAMSLATNLAVADALYAAGTGLFRVMPEPDGRAEGRLRYTARAVGVEWAAGVPMQKFQRTLDGSDPKQAALLMAIRRAGGGASYVPFDAANKPWHAAMAATYAHATAPLRRLADRYVVMAAWSVANGQPVPQAITDAFPKLPPVMEKADAAASQIDRAIIDLAEVALLSGQTQKTFAAVVTDVDNRGARIQFCDLPVVSRVSAHGVKPGDDVRVRITAADIATRTATFERVA